jgi:hypothetical protein
MKFFISNLDKRKEKQINTEEEENKTKWTKKTSKKERRKNTQIYHPFIN